MSVTTKDIAAACGVSRATVTRALSGNGSVKPETKEMILEKAEELGYAPDLIARSLVNGKSRMIGIVVVDLRNLYFSSIVDAISQRAKMHEYMVSICTHENDKVMEKKLIEMMKGYHVDGLILNCMNQGEKFQRWLKHLGIPYVILGYRIFPETYTVGIDEKKSAKDAVRFLVAHGYRKLVFVVPPLYGEDGEVNIYHYQRYTGFFEEAEIQGCEKHVLYGDYTNEQALALMREDAKEKPVFLCSGEMYAIPLLKFLKGKGYKNPQDFGLMTYDKLLQNVWDGEPIAAVDNHVELIGSTAADVLINLIEGRETSRNTSVLYELSEGKSI